MRITERLVASAAICFSMLSATTVFSATLTVGAGSDCNYKDIQSAIDHTTNGDEIHISGTYYGDLHLQMNDRSIAIIGSYGNCTDPDSKSALRTSLNGRGGADSILLIDGSANVTIKSLNFSDNQLNDVGTHGAGINYRGHGSLTLEDVGFSFNWATYGAGLNVSANGATNVYINQKTSFVYNKAFRQGGAINIEGDTHLYMLQPQTLIAYNHAGGDVLGNGGGIQINANAIADIASPSSGGEGVISRNTSDYGGGIAVEPDGELRLYSSDSSDPVTIAYNTANRTGGAIHVASSNYQSGGGVCGFVYHLDHNTAMNGSAIYSDTTGGDVSGSLILTPDNAACAQANEAKCPTGKPCNTIDDNVALQDGASTVLVQTGGHIIMKSLEMRRNKASHAIQLIDPVYSSGIYDTLIADNTLHANVIDVNDPGHYDFEIHACTIASNTLDPGAPVIASSALLDVRQSILWQPANTLVYNHGPGTVQGQGLIVSDDASFPGLGGVLKVTNPGFVEPGNDYHLRHDSPAVDFLPGSEVVESGFTLDGYRRAVHLGGNAATPYDAGVYERQLIPPATFPLVETFEELDPTGLELPTGWTGTQNGSNPGWFVTTRADDNSSYAVHTSDPGAPGESMLTSPAFHGNLLIFRHTYQLEPNYDVALLEIDVGDGFKDILDAGGRFVLGSYDHEMALGNPPNPIMRVGKLVWSGDLGTTPYSTVKVVLPPIRTGTTARLRWHVGSDGSGTHPGYWLDNVQLIDDAIFVDGFGG
jgi:predicted outer membrane repeat protein